MSISASSPLVPRHGLRIENRSEASRYLVPVGRALFAAIFLLSVPGHFAQGTIDHAAAAGVPLANVLVPLSGLLEAVGALSLLVGYRTRLGALLLAIFLVPVTLAMHRFWGIAEPMKAQMQQINFMKNVALLGATFMIMYFGAGPVSVDERAGR